MQLNQPRLNLGIQKNFHGVRDQDLQQFWDQGSKFKVELWDQAEENIPLYDPDMQLIQPRLNPGDFGNFVNGFAKSLHLLRSS